MKDVLLNGIYCPECDATMWIDPGYPGSQEEPPEKSTTYCTQCGFEREPTDQEILKILGFD